MARGIQIQLSVRDDGTAVVQKVTGEIQKMERAATGGAGRMVTAFQKVRTNWLALSVAGAGAALAIKKAWDFTRVAAQFEEDIGRLNQQLAGFNSNAKQLIPTMIDLANGQLSMAESAQLAGRGLAAGLDPAGLEKFVKLADVAGDVLGRSLPQAFDELVKAASTGRGALLKQLGIYVDLELETDKLAKATGRTTTQISEQEKAAIGLRKILEQADTAIDKFGSAQASTADKMTAIEKRFDDLTLKAGKLAKAIGVGLVDALDLLGERSEKLAQGEPLTLSEALAQVAIPGGLEAVLGSRLSNLIEELRSRGQFAPPGDAGQQRAQERLGRMIADFEIEKFTRQQAEAARVQAELTQAQFQEALGREIVSRATERWKESQALLNVELTRAQQALKDMQANVAPAIAELQKLQKQEEALVRTEAQLLKQRKDLAEQSQVEVARLLTAILPQPEAELLPELQLQNLEDQFASLTDKAAQAGGSIREEFLRQAQALIPEIGRLQLQLGFTEDFVERQVRDLHGTIVEIQKAAIDDQLEAVRAQQRLVREGIDALRRHAEGIADTMEDLFQRIERQSRGTVDKMQAQFLGFLETVQKAQIALAKQIPIETTSTVPGSTTVPSVPEASFAHGTAFVPRDMTARIHRGEGIIPAAQNPFNPAAARPANVAGSITIQGGINITMPSDDPREAAKRIKVELERLAAFN